MQAGILDWRLKAMQLWSELNISRGFFNVSFLISHVILYPNTYSSVCVFFIFFTCTCRHILQVNTVFVQYFITHICFVAVDYFSICRKKNLGLFSCKF